MTMRDRAVELARQGFRVFPLAPGTKNKPVVPRTWRGEVPKGKYFDLIPSNDPDFVHQMWSSRGNSDDSPLNFNIGICTNDLFVLDIDVKGDRPGFETWKALVAEYGVPENTLATLTPTGGQHHFYKLPNGGVAKNTQSVLGPGVDTRGWHGYVVAPGSRVSAGEYKWLIGPDRAEMAVAPAELLARVLASTEKPKLEIAAAEPDSPDAVRRATEWLREHAPEAQEGCGGDSTTYRVACRVKDFGITEHVCYELMSDHWNPDKAIPPWSEGELEQKVINAYAYGQNPIGVSSAQADFDCVELEVESCADSSSTDSDPAASRLPPFLDIAAWATREPKPRNWVVRDRIVNGNVALMTGDGGMGKTILTYELAMLVPAEIENRVWLNAEVIARGPAIMLCCEDDEDEFQRRGTAIAAHHGIDLASLAGRLHLISMTGQMDTQLAIPDKNGLLKPTKLWTELTERACDIKPGILVLDNVADLFGGEEIIRAQVRGFITLLRGLATKAQTAVVLNAHPSLSGIKSGRGTSGSTHWHNSVRHRFYMRKAEGEEKIPGVEDLRVVEIMKNQYGGGQGSIVPMRWQDGMFVTMGVAEVQQINETKVEEAEALFLELLPRFEVTRKKGGVRYAPKVFANTDEAGQRFVNYAFLEEAMGRLWLAGDIAEKEIGTVRHPKQKLVLRPLQPNVDQKLT
jgi:RecA-family ATPase